MHFFLNKSNFQLFICVKNFNCLSWISYLNKKLLKQQIKCDCVKNVGKYEKYSELKRNKTNIKLKAKNQEDIRTKFALSKLVVIIIVWMSILAAQINFSWTFFIVNEYSLLLLKLSKDKFIGVKLGTSGSRLSLRLWKRIFSPNNSQKWKFSRGP